MIPRKPLHWKSTILKLRNIFRQGNKEIRFILNIIALNITNKDAIIDSLKNEDQIGILEDFKNNGNL